MRGIETGKVRIRHEVFTEIARMAYEGGDYAKRLEELPFKIIPGEIGSYRDSLFLERAVVGERLRLAMGLPLRKFSEFSLLSDGVEKALDPEIYYEKPLINVIKFACNRCPDNVVKITNVCQGCLEHPCMSVCPRQAISRQNGQAHIDPDKCIRCGRCLKECKFNAIVRLERPCRKACGMDCIHSDGLGRADIDYSKCTSCGQCMVSCPFGAISDKSQIFQTIQAVKSDTPVYVALAPAFVGQFGPEGVPERMRRAFQRLGFADVYEVAIGADLCVIEEAADFLEEVPEKHKFMVTSCCPSWSDMVKKLFPQFEKNISVAFTPMVLTARMIKRDHPCSSVRAIRKSSRRAARACAATWTSCSRSRRRSAFSPPRAWIRRSCPRTRRSCPPTPAATRAALPIPAAWRRRSSTPSTTWTPSGRSRSPRRPVWPTAASC